MATRQVTVPIKEIYDLEVVCPGCQAAHIVAAEGQRRLPASCPVCDQAFGPRFTEALHSYLKFLKSARAVKVGVNLRIQVDKLDANREQVALVSGGTGS
jgi:hypothetical protein